MKEEKNIEITPLLEIIYDLYKEDVKGGKLRKDLFKGCRQVVEKSAPQSQTFQ
jgi:hypothetical protein